MGPIPTGSANFMFIKQRIESNNVAIEKRKRYLIANRKAKLNIIFVQKQVGKVWLIISDKEVELRNNNDEAEFILYSNSCDIMYDGLYITYFYKIEDLNWFKYLAANCFAGILHRVVIEYV